MIRHSYDISADCGKLCTDCGFVGRKSRFIENRTITFKNYFVKSKKLITDESAPYHTCYRSCCISCVQEIYRTENSLIDVP